MNRLLSLGLALFATGAMAQETPAPVPPGIGTPVVVPARGRQAFEAACQRCHGADDLARQTYRSTGDLNRPDFCVFLETHGLLDAARDCDVIAYLKTLVDSEGPDAK